MTENAGLRDAAQAIWRDGGAGEVSKVNAVENVGARTAQGSLRAANGRGRSGCADHGERAAQWTLHYGHRPNNRIDGGADLAKRRVATVSGAKRGRHVQSVNGVGLPEHSSLESAVPSPSESVSGTPHLHMPGEDFSGTSEQRLNLNDYLPVRPRCGLHESLHRIYMCPRAGDMSNNEHAGRWDFRRILPRPRRSHPADAEPPSPRLYYSFPNVRRFHVRVL